MKKREKIVSIGDQVTYTILKHGIQPLFCVVDYRTRRGKCSSEVIEKIKSYGEKVLVVKNPAGVLTEDLINAVESAYNDMPENGLRIEVDGEEDLASLVAIYLAPKVVTVIYGLPDKGVLVVESKDEYKDKAKEIIDKM